MKLEGGVEQAEVIAGLVSAGIPVMAHCGLCPQSVHQLGGYRVQRDAERLLADALAAQQAGAFGIVLECIPAALAARITAELKIPTIGIGGGAGCDGQILVFHDLLGLTPGRLPRHVKPYAELQRTVLDAVTRYRDDVRQGTFPGPEQTFGRGARGANQGGENVVHGVDAETPAPEKTGSRNAPFARSPCPTHPTTPAGPTPAPSPTRKYHSAVNKNTTEKNIGHWSHRVFVVFCSTSR